MKKVVSLQKESPKRVILEQNVIDLLGLRAPMLYKNREKYEEGGDIINNIGFSDISGTGEEG